MKVLVEVEAASCAGVELEPWTEMRVSAGVHLPQGKVGERKSLPVMFDN